MAEKTDEEIIQELSLETSDDSNSDKLEELSLDTSEESLELIEEKDDSPDTNEEEKEENPQSSNEDNQTESSEESNEENKVIADSEEEDVPVQKKQPKIFRILIGVLAFLAVVLIAGLVMFFTGFFDPEVKEEPKMDKEKMAMEAAKKEQMQTQIDIKELDKKRLNKKLQMLTKTEIMNKEELEAEERRIKEEERKKEEAKQKAIDEKKRLEEEKEAAKRAEIQKELAQLKQHQEDVKKQQEEFLRIQEEAKMQLENQRLELLKELEEQKNKVPEPVMTPKEMPKEVMKEEMVMQKEMPKEEMMEKPSEEEPKDMKNTFLQFINVATIKGNLFKSYLDKVQAFDKNLSLCRDNKNRIEVLFGPYDSEKTREKVFNNLIENGYKESYLIDFTQEEYEKRCKY